MILMRTKKEIFLLLLIVFALFSAFSAGADTIFLKNGRTLEGLIEKETPNGVIIDLGFGTMTVDRSTISRIVRSDKDGTAKIKTGWSSDYYDNERFAPDNLKPLVRELRDLEDRRSDAIKSNLKTRLLFSKSRELNAELDELQKQYFELNKKLQQASPNLNMEAYNTLIVEVNSVGARMTTQREELNRIKKAQDELQTPVSAYMEKLSQFEVLYEEQKNQHALKGMKENEKVFFDKIDQRLQVIGRDFQEVLFDLPAHNRDHIIVKASINDSVQGEFILDTGATTVTISESLASRLKIDFSKIHPIEVILADGKKILAKPYLLSSVQLGDARIENVMSIIMPAPPSPGIDGLLGMTLLRNFIIQLDSSKNKLILKKFYPQK
jgi:clan AA aspartic protease (TIGR02281 family)